MSKRNQKGRHVKTEKQTIAKGDVAKVTAAQPMDETAKTAAPAPEVKPVLIKVLKKDAKFRGAREAWYTRLLEHDGRPVDEYVESCKAKCPQVTKNGTVENPTGWVGFFKRQGIMQEVKPT